MFKVPSAQHWRKIVARGKYPLIFIYELNCGLLKTHEITGLKTKMTNYCRVRGGSYIDEGQAQSFIKETRKILQKNPAKTLEWIKDFHQQTAKLFLWLKEVDKKLKSNNLSKSDLKKLYRQYENKVTFIWQWGYLSFLVQDAVEIELNDLLSKLGYPKNKINQAFKILTIAPKLSLYQRQERELLKLAAKVKKQGIEKSEKQISAHLKKWAWVNSWVYFQYPISEKELKKEISALIKKEPIKILKQAEIERKNEIEKRKKFLAQFKNQRLNALAKVLADYTLWHGLKMEEMTKAVYLAKPLFEKLAAALSLSYRQLIEMTPEEVEKEKINLKIINARVKDNGVIMINGKWRPLAGKEIDYVKSRLEQKPKDLNKLTGVVAFEGQVAGRAVLASEGADVSKVRIKKGDILVVAMTTTNMVPLVKKAAAVVTDEGGVLCHAAIIARELKKPTVINTRFATKIFKTGDRLEVDADKGVVRKVK